MERLILSEEMSGFSIRTNTDGIQEQDTRTNSDTGKPLRFDGQTDGLSSTSAVSEQIPSSVPSNSSIGAGFDLSGMCDANSGSSPSFAGRADWRTASTLPPTSPSISNDDTQAVRNANLGSGGGFVHAGETAASSQGQVPAGTSLAGPELSGSGGAADRTRDCDELAAEVLLGGPDSLFGFLFD